MRRTAVIGVCLALGISMACSGASNGSSGGPSSPSDDAGATTTTGAKEDAGNGNGKDAGGASAGDAAISDAGASADVTEPEGGTIATPPGWTLYWSDEFDGADGSDVDPTKWVHDVGEGSDTAEGVWSPGFGWGNDELEYYTPGTANTEQRGGYLLLTAAKNTNTNYVCSFADNPKSATTTYHQGTCEYTSGRIKTVLGPPAKGTGIRQNLFSHLYGRFEMRAQIPAGVGFWPAFWTMGSNLFTQNWPACGELDIMEEVGEQPGTVYGTSHSTKSGDNGVPHSMTLPNGANLSDAFHVYAIEWDPTSIRWLLDDAVYGTETAPAGATTADWPFADPTNPFFIILNLAISSGDTNSWGAAPTAATTFPAQMKVDYVSVYTAANGDP